MIRHLVAGVLYRAALTVQARRPASYGEQSYFLWLCSCAMMDLLLVLEDA